MLKNDYQYALMLYREGQVPLGQVEVTVDWEPAREWAEFRALRQNLVTAKETVKVSTVQPLWHSTLGEPYLKGFRVTVESNGTREVSADFTRAYFRQLAKQASALLMKKGVLKKRERFKFLVAAFPQQKKTQEEEDVPKLSFTMEEVAPDLALRDVSLAELDRASIFQGKRDDDDMPLFIPQRVLAEAKALSKEAGAKETGGILIGHLGRDSQLPEIFAQVTAQIPARHTEASLTSLTFTSETWTAVRNALDLRRKGELMLGWWHSHPVREWCKDCSAESQKACAMAVDFFSAHDHALHRTVFPRAYSVALVVNDLSENDATFSMFGWRRGLLESRGFHLTGATEQPDEQQAKVALPASHALEQGG